MNRILCFLRGTVRLTASGANPEEFLNLCAAKNVIFWDTARREPFTLSLSVTAGELEQVKHLAGKAQCDLTVERKAGLPYFLRRFRKRWLLLAGAVLCIAALCYFSRCILMFDVTGNESVSSAEILMALRHNGIQVGTYGPSISERELSHKILLEIPELSFFSLNLHGTRAEVIVREKTEPPEVVDETQIANVVSAADGIITEQRVLAGQARFQEGDVVLKGEILISGVIDLPEPEYADTDLGTMEVHAQGEITARTWRTLTAKIPLEAQIKAYTGQKTVRFSMEVLGRRINFFGNGGISYPEYDKITTSKTLTLPDGERLPFRLIRETFRAYDTRTEPVDETEAEALLQERLLEALSVQLDQGEILKTEFVTRKSGGYLSVTLLAECTEQIGRTELIEPQTGPS